MTTDIMLRLRQTAENWQGTRPPESTVVQIFCEAADEIEKLRHEWALAEHRLTLMKEKYLAAMAG